MQPASTLSSSTYPKQEQLEALSKIYKDDADKYSGHKDSFQHKLLIFKDVCCRACLDPLNMEDVFSFLVIGKARDVYLDKVVGKDYNFEQICAIVQSEFETAAWKNGLLTTWTGMSLPAMFDRYPGKSRPEVFEKMVSELRRVQRGLDITYNTDEALRLRIINACWLVPELEQVLARPAASAESVCGEIRSVLNIRASRSSSSQYYSSDSATQGQHIMEAIDQYLSERRYNFSSQTFWPSFSQSVLQNSTTSRQGCQAQYSRATLLEVLPKDTSLYSGRVPSSTIQSLWTLLSPSKMDRLYMW